MSEMERSIYDMTSVWSPVEQRQICCHPQVVVRLQNVTGDDLVPLQLLKDAMITFSKQVITATLYSTLLYWQVLSLCHIHTLSACFPKSPQAVPSHDLTTTFVVPARLQLSFLLTYCMYLTQGRCDDIQ